MLEGINPAIFAFVGALGLSAVGISTRYVMRNAHDPWATVIVNQLFSALLALLFVSALGIGFWAPADFDFATVPAWAYLAMLCSSAFFIAALYFIYKAYHTIEAGEARVIGQLQTVLVLIAGVVLLGEAPSMLALLGIALVIFAVLLATYGVKMHKLKADGVRLVLLYAVAISAVTILDKIAIPNFPPFLYAAQFYLIPGVAACAIGGRKAFAEAKLIAKKYPAQVAAAVFGNTLGSAAILIAYKTMDVSLVTPIVSTSTVMTVLAAGALLGENKGMARKVAAALVAMAGVALIAL